jgi:hypothetical protein
MRDDWKTTADWGRTGEIPPPPAARPWTTSEIPTTIRPRRMPILMVVVFMVLADAVALLYAVMTPPPAPTSSPVTTTVTVDPGPGLGDKVQGSGLEYTVHSKQCGISRMGSDVKPHGSFCRLDVSVRNVTDKAHFFRAVVVGVAPRGEFGADGLVAFPGEFNPGDQVRSFVYFDVPGEARLTSVTFGSDQDAVVWL